MDGRKYTQARRLRHGEIIRFPCCRFFDKSGRMKKESPAIGIIGGSGLYEMEECAIRPKFRLRPRSGAIGRSSARKVGGRQVYFCATAVVIESCHMSWNHWANIYALRSLNVR
jgi:purine nucleoside phosphorylase